jgi:hypothetical protein
MSLLKLYPPALFLAFTKFILPSLTVSGIIPLSVVKSNLEAFMSDHVLIVEDGKAKLIKRKKYTDERTLQELLEEYPQLISLHDIEDDPLPLYPIGWEVGVPPGAIDIMYCDSSGLITIVETKLAKNPQVRREVIGQVLEYASYVHDMNFEDIEYTVEQYLKRSDRKFKTKARTLIDYFNDAISHNEDDKEKAFDAFKENVSKNLSDARIRLIVAVDEINDPLRNTVTFVNNHSQFEILVLQMKRFPADDGRQMFIPSLFGYSPRTDETKEILTPESFKRVAEPGAWKIYEDLIKLAQKRRDKIGWHKYSFSYYMFFKEKRFVPFTVWTNSVGFFKFQLDPVNGISKESKNKILDEARKISNLAGGINNIDMKEPGMSLKDGEVTDKDIKQFLKMVRLYESLIGK